VQAVSQANPDFHPRYDALARRYRYRVFCQAVRHPLRERYAWRVWPTLDIDRLQQAATHLVGIHDFSAFGTPPRAGGVTIRDVKQAGWHKHRDEFVFEILANAFLYRMVRRLVHVQVKIGLARLAPDAILTYLESGLLDQGVAPPQGLTLVEVIYPS
jgi:tRNA pseudouridine38-40 synthase